MEEGAKKSISLSEIAYIGMLVFLLAIVLVYVGRPKVGLMDVARLTRALGLEGQITGDAKEWEDRALQDAKKLQQDFNEQAQALRKQMDEAETDGDKEAAQKEMRAAGQTLQRESAAIRERLSAHSREVLMEFRSRLQPFVDRVARRKRLWIVLDRASGVVYASAQVDITDAVAEAAKEAFGKEPLLPAASPREDAAAPFVEIDTEQGAVSP